MWILAKQQHQQQQMDREAIPGMQVACYSHVLFHFIVLVHFIYMCILSFVIVHVFCSYTTATKTNGIIKLWSVATATASVYVLL